MNLDALRALLGAVEAGESSVDDALDRLRNLPFEDVGFARIDHHRSLRTGAPEVVFAEGKTAEQVAAIVDHMLAAECDVLVTRLDAEKAGALPEDGYDAVARTWARRIGAFNDRGRGLVRVVCAGTSDLPVAQEALVTLGMMGNRAELTTDVGVAGLHRILSVRHELAEAEVIIAVAGMEGALPGVVAGLLDRPVIAVPTSVGYGTGAGGYAALLTMLNSCAPGLTVVNIDNGFGAAMAASAMNRRRS
jgi:pyridinium-3,5-biscarboxylic acid mononucleotide synthase